MRNNIQTLRVIEIHGPTMPEASKLPGSLWSVTLNAPYFGAGKTSPLQQEDRTHPLRTLLLDVAQSNKPGRAGRRTEPWRRARLLALHVIGGSPEERFQDTHPLQLRTQIGAEHDLESKHRNFYTGRSDREVTLSEVVFQQIVVAPLLESDQWPDPISDGISVPPCRLLQGSVPLFVDPNSIPWLSSPSILKLKKYNFKNKTYVRLTLAPDGIELEAKVPFLAADGGELWIPGRFLLSLNENAELEMRLLARSLSQEQQNEWSAKWQALTPSANGANQPLGFWLELRKGVPPPDFVWQLQLDDDKKVCGFKPGIRVPATDVVGRLLGPLGPETNISETTLRPDFWVLSAPGHAGALASIQEQSETVWNQGAADWGSVSADVAQWKGAPLLTAVILPTCPKPGEKRNAPATGLRLDTSDATIQASLCGEHALAHDEIALASALRMAQGLQEFPPGIWDPRRPLLAGFVPLADGWLQLPLPNLPLPNPEKDNELISSPVADPPNVMHGFLRYGETQNFPDVLSAFPTQNPTQLGVQRAPWEVTVEATQGIAVAAALGNSWTKRATAFLIGPQLSTRGLLWLSADRPDDLEALPRLGAGPGAYLDVPLKSLEIQKQPIQNITLSQLKFEVMGQPGKPDRVTREGLALDCRFNPAAPSWDPDADAAKLWNDVLNDWYTILLGTLPRQGQEKFLPPVVWLRHPAMPLASLMPMTRSASSSVRPLESREFVPLVVDSQVGKDGGSPLRLLWTSGSSSVFAELDGQLKVRPVAAWPWPETLTAGVAFGAFGVPGVELRWPKAGQPAATLSDFWRALQYALRFDLPSLDEAFATATLPPVGEVKTDEQTDAPPPAIPNATALDWRSMSDLWKFQDQRHQLARVAHSYLDDFADMGRETRHDVRDLVGGAIWSTTFGFTAGQPTDHLPYGAVSFNGNSIEGNAALLGFSDSADVVWEIHKQYLVSVTGYAPSTIRDGTMLVDSRGTGVEEMRASPDGFWTRSVFLRWLDGNRKANALKELRTCRAVLPVLDFAGGKELLRFWFKDLPVASDTLQYEGAHGIEPDAWGDGVLPTAGAEWRLWDANEENLEKLFERGRDILPFFGFGLEPLRLEVCDLKDGAVTILCRLHLGPREQSPTRGGNLVELKLRRSEAGSYFIENLTTANGALIFPLTCRESSAKTRRVEISLSCSWKDGTPVFSDAAVSIEMLESQVKLTTNVDVAQVPGEKIVRIAWKQDPNLPELAPGEGQMWIEGVEIETGTEAIATITAPTLKVTRGIRLFPALGNQDEKQAPAPIVVLARAGEPLKLTIFGECLPVGDAMLDDEDGVISFTVQSKEEVRLTLGGDRTGQFSAGFIGRVGEFSAVTGIAVLRAGYLNGRWTEHTKAAPDQVPDSISLEAVCGRRNSNSGDGVAADRWIGSLTLNLHISLKNAIRWPSLKRERDNPVLPYPGVGNRGREVLVFNEGATGYSHQVDYVFDGHTLSFGDISRMSQPTDEQTVCSAIVMATHRLTPQAQHKEAMDFAFTAVETVAFGRVAALIPRPDQPPNFSGDPIAFAARYRDCLINPQNAHPAPGMVAAGQGRISTVMSGTLGNPFRAAFWANQKANSLALAGGFAGFIGDATKELAAENSQMPLLRLPMMAWFGAQEIAVNQGEERVEVASADGTSALPITVAWRTAVAPSSASDAALRQAILAGGIVFDRDPDIEAAILVEQSFRVNMDDPRAGNLQNTIFFPAASAAISLLMTSSDRPVTPAVLSLLAGSALGNVARKPFRTSFAAPILTRTAPSRLKNGNAKSSLDSLLALLGDASGVQKNGLSLGSPEAGDVGKDLLSDVVLDSWDGPFEMTGKAKVNTIVTGRAFAVHTRPRAALIVEMRNDGSVIYNRATLPTRTVRAKFQPVPKLIAFADGQRGFALPPAPDAEGWLRGMEEGTTYPFRDAEKAGTEPVKASGLAGLSRQVALPAQALSRNDKDPAPVWSVDLRVPVYHPLRDLKGVVGPSISWLAPGRTRPRLPTRSTIETAVQAIARAGTSDVQYIVPEKVTAASLGDRAGISLVRTSRLETTFGPLETTTENFGFFDESFTRFGRPAQGGTWSFRTERTPRPGPLPENGSDARRNRRPCASRLEPRSPVEVLRGPAETISGEAEASGKYGAWVVKMVAAADWDGMISDRFDGTVAIDVEIDVKKGSEFPLPTPAAMLRRLLMPDREDRPNELQNLASLAVGEAVITFQRIHFFESSGGKFKSLPDDRRPEQEVDLFRGTLRLVLDARTDQSDGKPGRLLPEFSDALGSARGLPVVELRLTTLPESRSNGPDAAAEVFMLSQVDPKTPEVPGGPVGPPVTLSFSFTPVMQSRGALPLAPNSLLFIDPAYDSDLGSMPAMSENRRLASPKTEPKVPLPAGRGTLLATLYVDRQRVSCAGSIVFMMDIAFEQPLSAAARVVANERHVDGDLVRPNDNDVGEFELSLAVTTQHGVRRQLLLGRPKKASHLPKIRLARVYELALDLLFETDGSPSKLSAGDMLEVKVAEQTEKRVKPIVWDAERATEFPLAGLEESDVPVSRVVRILLVDQAVIEPPPALYAALTRREVDAEGAEKGCQLSLPLYAQSPLPKRVILPNAKEDFRRGFVRRAATFIWNLARPASELTQTGVYIVKVDRNGQTYLPFDPGEFRCVRRIPNP